MRLSNRILFGEGALRRRVTAMASAIAADTSEGETLSVLALMDGAFMFCADLVRGLSMPVRVAFVPVISVARGGVPEQIRLPADFPVRGADLLVVEDILDTGCTLSALRSHLETLGPRRVRIAVLLDKPARRQIGITPEYVGFQVDDRWAVGYGMDYQGLYRNLPYVSFVEPV
jgi:hypoxanthine phosphoribosyltransferase